MIFEISNLLLERAVEVSNKIRNTVAETVIKALNLGLNQLNESRIESNTETASVNGNGDSSSGMITLERFIRENYQKMSDQELGNKLGYSPFIIGMQRRKLGLLKRNTFHLTTVIRLPENPKTGGEVIVAESEPDMNLGIHELPSTLTDEQKQKVREKLPIMKVQEIATELSVSVGEIFRARNEIAKKFIEENWKTKSDHEIAVELGLKYGVQIARIRSELGFSRLALKRKIPEDFDLKKLKKALTEDGETLESFIKKEGLTVSRQRISMLMGDSEINTKRKASWYAKRYNVPQLADKAAIESLLADKKRISPVALGLGITSKILKQVLSIHGIVFQDPPKAEKIELTCSHCGNTFRRRKKLVEGQRKKHPNQKLYFCSMKCKGQRLGSLKGTGEMVKLTCKICKNTFERRSSAVKEGQLSFYCSMDCRKKDLPHGRPESDTKVTRCRIQLTCDECGNEFSRIAYRANKATKTGKHFCSSKCCGSFLNKTYIRKADKG